MKKCVCIITKQPTTTWLDFLNDITAYDVYLLIDDNSINYNFMYGKIYPNIHFIQINNNDCKKHGFTNSSVTTGLPPIIAWDKSLYYFTKLNQTYDHVWFIEDDVFFHSEETLQNVDVKYPDADILVSKCNENKPGEWLWSRIKINFPPPHYCAMVCAVRMSKQLLFHIGEYVDENHTLFCIEAMFASIAKKNNLKYVIPDELKTIVYQQDWQISEINKTNLYHPIKKIDMHAEIRDMLV